MQEFRDTQQRDKIKYDYCIQNNIPLLCIKFDDPQGPLSKLLTFLIDIGFDISNRV